MSAVPVSPVQFIRGRRVKDAALRARRPSPTGSRCARPARRDYLRLKGLMRELNLHTVCEEAHCPNIGECWHHGTATFMIMGDVCTRACGYCNVHARRARRRSIRTSRKTSPTPSTRWRSPTSSSRRSIATTSPTSARARSRRRFARSRRARPECRVEVLIPDFQGEEAPLRTVLDARPDVLNHNTETVPRLYRRRGPAAGTRARSSCSTARAAWRRTSRPRPA